MNSEVLLLAGGALAIMIVASVFSRRTGVATPLLLVALGIGVSYIPATPSILLDPELILAGILPLLLYGSAVQLPVIDVRRNVGLIGWLAVGLVIISAVVVGFGVHFLFPAISLPLAIAIGAVVSPTDAVAATAIGRRVGLPPRLMSILEGESLVNDASSLVVLRAAVAAMGMAAEFSVGHTLGMFVWAVVGALVVGVVVGWLSVLLRQRLDDPVLNTAVSFVVPFVAYLPAEEIHASGLLSVVAAGVVSGTLSFKRLSARDRQTQGTTWASITYVLESGLFLAMGYELPPIAAAAANETTGTRIAVMVGFILAVLLVVRFGGLAVPWLMQRVRPDGRSARVLDRVADVEEQIDQFEPRTEFEQAQLDWAKRRIARTRADIAFDQRERLGSKAILTLGWAGMRGAVTVAAAQTFPIDVPFRSTGIFVAFLVALITLVLFGLTLPGVIRRLGFTVRTPEEKRNDLVALMHQVGVDATDAVGPLDEQTVDGQPLDPWVVADLTNRVLPRILSITETAPVTSPDLTDQAVTVQRRYLEAMREGLLRERSIGAYSSHTFHQAEQILDRLEQRLG